MKNIKVPKRVGNSIVKHAYLELIADSIAKITKATYLSLDGYENDNDRVKFIYGRKKCVLHGVWKPSLDAFVSDTLPLTVFTTNDGVTDRWDIVIPVKDFRFKTLDRIAYEVYDYCKAAEDPDYEEAIKDYIAGGMDNYREFMS